MVKSLKDKINKESANNFFSKAHSHNSSDFDLSNALVPLLYNYTGGVMQQHIDFSEFINPTIPTEPRISIQICNDNGLQVEDDESISNVSLWIEGFFQFLVGIIGVISNLVAIPILCSTSMKSIFNKLLICLLTLHTIYLFGALLTVVMWPPWEPSTNSTSEGWFLVLFSFVLYPSQNVMLYASTFITMLMARQRFLAIRHPIEYRNSTLTINAWVPAVKSLMFVLIVSGVFTLPQFFETSVINDEVGLLRDVNETHFRYVSVFDSSFLLISVNSIYNNYKNPLLCVSPFYLK